MLSLNKATLIGNLTRDVELKVLPSGKSVGNFGLATNRVWKDKDGKKQEAVQFHNIVVFGPQAETLAQYCFKGHQIYIEGRIETRSWEKDGEKKYTTEIVLENFQFGSKGREKGTDETSQLPMKEEPSVQIDETEEVNAEDIPFN